MASFRFAVGSSTAECTVFPFVFEVVEEKIARFGLISRGECCHFRIFLQPPHTYSQDDRIRCGIDESDQSGGFASWQCRLRNKKSLIKHTKQQIIGYIASIPIKKLLNLSIQYLGVSVLDGFHFTKHNAFVLSFSVYRMHFGEKGIFC